jgi:hypothetical protein
MDFDTGFPTKLSTVDDAPEPFRSALVGNVVSHESVRLIVYAPALVLGERLPATVLAVTDKSWLIASETEGGATASIEKSNFSDTLFLELSSILLSGKLKIHFARVGASFSAATTFEVVGEELYREAIDLMLNGIDPTPSPAPEDDRDAALISEAWPIKFRIEAQRSRPKGQRLLAAIQWPAIFGGFQRELCPAGALLVTKREIVLISEEKTSALQHSGDIHEFGGIITHFPVVRLADLHVYHQERFGVLALQVHATHGGEKLEIIFPSDHENAVSKAMEQVRVPVGGSIQ